MSLDKYIRVLERPRGLGRRVEDDRDRVTVLESGKLVEEDGRIEGVSTERTEPQRAGFIGRGHRHSSMIIII